MTARLLCCVPFCSRTTAKPFAEWICAKHWPLVPRKVKAFRRKADAAAARAKAVCEALTGLDDARYPDAMLAKRKAYGRSGRAWERCKRAAIEAAMGIA